MNKAKEETVSLEQQSRMAHTGESLEQKNEETYARQQVEPQIVDLARRLGVLYEQKEDTENAIAWYQYAADLTSGSDPSLVRKVADLQQSQSDHEITAHEKFLATHGPEAMDYAARSDALALAKQQRAEPWV